MDDLNRLIGRLEQSAIDAKDTFNRFDARFGELDARLDQMNTTLNDLRPVLMQAAEHGADWSATKRKGLLWLAGVGASGLMAGAGGKTFIVWLMQALPK